MPITVACHFLVSSDLGLAAMAPFRMVLITAAPPKDTTLARLDADVPEWAAGYMLRRERLGVIRLDLANRYPYGTPESVFAHEVTHLMIGDAVGDRLPLWFEEGVATWAGRAWRLEDLRIVSARIIYGDAPRLEDLEAGFHGTAGAAEESYAASFAFVRWSTNRFGDDVLRRVIDATRTRSFPAAWQSATGEPLERSEAAWRSASRWDYRWLPILSVTSPLWIGIMVLSVFVWLKRRARALRLRETWELEPSQNGSSRSRAPGAAGAGGLGARTRLGGKAARITQLPALNLPICAVECGRCRSSQGSKTNVRIPE